MTPPAAPAPLPRVSVIVPTTCETARGDLITRSIGSVFAQAGVTAELILVVNGSLVDQCLLDQWRREPRLTVHRIDEGNVSRARVAGLRQATGEFFSFLDDDDEFLPGALELRARLLRGQPELDVVVTNGFHHVDHDVTHVSAAFESTIHADLGGSFLRQNWFASPASMFRRATCEIALFDTGLQHFEWTYLFFRLLSAGKRFHFDGRLTYRKYENNPASISRTAQYELAWPSILRRVLDLPLERRLKVLIRDSRLTALNHSSVLLLKGGHVAEAAGLHWQCLKAGGWRFLPYTGRLVAAALRGPPASQRDMRR